MAGDADCEEGKVTGIFQGKFRFATSQIIRIQDIVKGSFLVNDGSVKEEKKENRPSPRAGYKHWGRLSSSAPQKGWRGYSMVSYCGEGRGHGAGVQ